MTGWVCQVLSRDHCLDLPAIQWLCIYSGTSERVTAGECMSVPRGSRTVGIHHTLKWWAAGPQLNHASLCTEVYRPTAHPKSGYWCLTAASEKATDDADGDDTTVTPIYINTASCLRLCETHPLTINNNCLGRQFSRCFAQLPSKLFASGILMAMYRNGQKKSFLRCHLQLIKQREFCGGGSASYYERKR